MKNMKIACIGDSLTRGYGVSEGDCWVSLLNDETPHHWLNLGVNGESSGEILQRLQRSVSACQPQRAILLCGVNDFIFSINDEKTALSHIKQMTRLLSDHQISAFVGIPPQVIPSMARKAWVEGTDYDKVNQRILSYKDLLTEYCEKQGLPVLDFFALFSSHLKRESPEDLYTDGLHPTALGHRLICEMIKERLLPLL